MKIYIFVYLRSHITIMFASHRSLLLSRHAGKTLGLKPDVRWQENSYKINESSQKLYLYSYPGQDTATINSPIYQYDNTTT